MFRCVLQLVKCHTEGKKHFSSCYINGKFYVVAGFKILMKRKLFLEIRLYKLRFDFSVLFHVVVVSNIALQTKYRSC
jgi:hypothetical protein